MFVLSCGDQEYVCVDSALNPKPKENPKSGCFSNCACLPWMTHKHTPSLLDVRLTQIPRTPHIPHLKLSIYSFRVIDISMKCKYLNIMTRDLKVVTDQLEFF